MFELNVLLFSCVRSKVIFMLSITCHISHITCQMSKVKCQMHRVTGNMSMSVSISMSVSVSVTLHGHTKRTPSRTMAEGFDSVLTRTPATVLVGLACHKP